MKPENWKKLWIATVLLVIFTHGVVLVSKQIGKEVRKLSDWAGTVSFYKYGGAYDISHNELLVAERLYLEYTGGFSHSRQRRFYIPEQSWNVLVVREHCIDGRYWIAFTVDKEKLDATLYPMTGYHLADFKDGIIPTEEYWSLPSAPGWLKGRKLAQYWDLASVKNGKNHVDGYAYCAVDMDTGRISVTFP